jgi:4-hydroxymandelate oxidase
MHDNPARRRFLRFLAASPLFAGLDSPAWQQALIASPQEALSVFDFEPVARKNIPPAHFGYLSTGVDDDRTLRANHEAYSRIQLRPRRLIDVSRADLSTTLFGAKWETPIVLAPTSGHKAFHPGGELAVARAAGTRNVLQMLSTNTTTGVEEVVQAAGRPIWYQLYPASRWDVTEKLVHRAEAAGCPVLALTVDQEAGRNTETASRMQRLDTRPCAACHPTAPGAYFARRAMFTGIDVAGISNHNPSLTWDFVDKLRAITRMKIVIKGIVTHEDAQLCVEHGVDGLVVSNHGGRGEESGRATIESLPEVVEAVRGRFPVLIDGGIRRGTDIVKALALGASAIAIGRPYLWGLGAFGQPGVERVIDLLRAELELAMKQVGARVLAEIVPSHVLLPR